MRTITGWPTGRGRRAAVAAAAAAMVTAIGLAVPALADPTVTPAPTPTPTVTGSGGAAAAAATPTSAPAVAGDVLDQLADEYAVGAGGGQLSNLLKISLKLRSMGFKPSKANLAEIAQAMNYRPSLNPLIGALKDTIAYQQKIKAQMEILQQYQQQQANSAVLGGSQMPPGMGQPGMSVGQPGAAMVPPDAGAPMMPGPPPATP